MDSRIRCEPASTACPRADGAAPADGRTALVAGATGLVGREILQGLLTDDSVAAVHVLVRRALDLRHPRLTTHVVDFTALAALPRVDEVYLALGTTIKVAGSQPAFRAVDHDANLAVATSAQSAGATRLGLVSAMGAAARSPVFYNRVKGELEDDLARLGYEGLVLARPSLLIGDRAALGQPVRRGERWGEAVGEWLRPVIPANYRPIPACAVAKALLQAVPRAHGIEVLPSGRMQEMVAHP
jgi:uncharacterized protein YbjT (DUF2867 family)